MSKTSAVIASLVIPIVVIASFVAGCNNDAPARLRSLADARIETQGFVRLGPTRRPSARVDMNHASMYREPLDADSVELTEYDGNLYYWPVDLCHRGVEFLNAYRVSGDSTFLTRARRTATALNTIVVVADSARFCQYLFRYRLHRDVVMPAPWFSGMAQGEWAGFLTRMFEATGDSAYLHQARAAFESLLIIGPRKGPWVARIDSDGYYWIEEFPDSARPGMTLNGFVAAVFGVYDYFQATGDERAKQVYEASLTTLKHYLPRFRRPGGWSYYCLGHEWIANGSYHDLHASMMYHLERMSGDEFFMAMGDSLTADGEAAREAANHE